MANNNIILIIRREYLERVRRKSFIISTILMPVLLIAMMAMPALMVIWSSPESKTIAVVDASGVVAPQLAGNTVMNFIPTPESADSAKANEAYNAVLVIGKDVVEKPDNIQFYTREAAGMQTEQLLTAQITDIIENQRLSKYNIDNLQQIMQDVKANVSIQSFRLDEEGETETSSTASYIIGMVTMMILYMFILLYGQMVMNGIIEEKNNRVLEIVVSSVKPAQLLVGKILGIGSVALTQMLLWGILIFSFAQWGLPLLTSGMAGSEPELTATIGNLGDTGYIMGLFSTMTLLMMGGYLFYSAIYAAIGSAIDNIQDASQLQMFAVIPIIAGLIVSLSVVNDPDSTMAVWTSMIPFTSPMVMMTRVPFGVPGWQLALSVIILAASLVFMIWLSAKIYRVGIFMYGKKPTIKDLIRWARYK